MVKNPPISAKDTGDAGSIPGLGRSPEEEMATGYSLLAWEIPWTEEPGGLQSMGSQESDMAEHAHTQLSCGYIFVISRSFSS